MKKMLAVLYFVIVFSYGFAGAEEIVLPESVDAKATVVRAEKDGFWEKTLVVKFPAKRRLLSTNTGFLDALAAANHSAHPALWEKVAVTMKTVEGDGGKAYEVHVEKRLAQRLGLNEGDMAMMSTAADMDNLAVVTRSREPFTVVALVTAGARTNALRTGFDEGLSVEPDLPSQKRSKGSDTMPHGTVNIMVLTNGRLTDGAMARAIITATEAKTAAFEDLHIPSSYNKSVRATGTGTDSMIIVSGTSGPKVTYTGGHSKIGELIGKAVYGAVLAALEKQNGFRKMP